MPTTFSSIPEEIVERILSLVFTHHLPPAAPRPAWLQYPSTPHTVGIPRPPPSKSHHPRLSPLLVSRTWLRIATPLYYRNLSLHTPNQATSLAALLSSNPHLAKCIRSLSLHATFPSFQLISSLCPNIDELHLTVDNGAKPPTQPDGVSDDLRAFCQGISNITDLKHLTLRKNAYLTLPGPCLIFDHLTNALARWQSLVRSLLILPPVSINHSLDLQESVNVAFRSSHTSALSAFASALSRAPKLHSIHAVLPSVWNDALLEVRHPFRPSSCFPLIHHSPDVI